MGDAPPAEDRCGLCQAFVTDGRDRQGRTWGHCHRNPRTSTVGLWDDPCEDFSLDAGKLAAATRPAPERRAPPAPTPRRRPAAPPAPPKLRDIPLGEEGDSMDREELKSILSEVLDEALGVSDATLHPRYRGGKVVVHPANPELQSKEIPVEVFFRKVIGVREKLRVLEQKVNGSDLATEEKVQLQTYITACYGSLTTFNFLFQDRESGFKGSGGG